MQRFIRVHSPSRGKMGTRRRPLLWVLLVAASLFIFTENPVPVSSVMVGGKRKALIKETKKLDKKLDKQQGYINEKRVLERQLDSGGSDREERSLRKKIKKKNKKIREKWSSIRKQVREVEKKMKKVQKKLGRYSDRKRGEAEDALRDADRAIARAHQLETDENNSSRRDD
ncbi:hypothetical protein CSUI_003422 [Cystoisospora suis]|uniref:Uncharacterized protein n=1 Tax=Cystoisospora suis TaxID=483139 RepID=A0A2C6L4D7_9APIC|nr:hypothetical protein CSUI_003422 [Cystoisospora suis]